MMAQVRRGYELKTLFWGRPVRPFHLAVTLATATVGALLYIPNENIDGWGGFGAIVLATLATASAFLLTFGWWRSKDLAAEWGLLLATGVWLTRAIYVLITNGQTSTVVPWASALLSVSWAIGAGGAYMLERYDTVNGETEVEQ